jgi:hypothetical protein
VNSHGKPDRSIGSRLARRSPDRCRTKGALPIFWEVGLPGQVRLPRQWLLTVGPPAQMSGWLGDHGDTAPAAPAASATSIAAFV